MRTRISRAFQILNKPAKKLLPWRTRKSVADWAIRRWNEHRAERRERGIYVDGAMATVYHRIYWIVTF